MPETLLTKRVPAAADAVWQVMTDIPNAAENISGIDRVEMLTDGPVRKGTRWKETRTVFKREATEEMEITEWTPPRSYTADCVSCGMHFRWHLSVEPAGENESVVQMDIETKPLSFTAKVTGALMNGMMKKQCAKAFEKDLDDVVQVLANQPRSAV